MRIEYRTLADAATCRGVVVVVDVLRAFTTSAFALARGAREVYCVATVREALELRDALPGALAMGEVDGRPVAEFDLANSPSQVLASRVSGRVLIHRSTAGTQGVVRSVPRASEVYAASFVSAGATARAVAAHDPAHLTFVITGAGDHDGEEDRACASYIAAILSGDAPDPTPYLSRALSSDTARRFLTSPDDAFPASDVGHALALDAVDFAQKVDIVDRLPVIRPWIQSQEEPM